eukprot:jgi/Chrpa1/15678/Chrysochromulina_OHIO_Genome00021930-RA
MDAMDYPRCGGPQGCILHEFHIGTCIFAAPENKRVRKAPVVYASGSGARKPAGSSARKPAACSAHKPVASSARKPAGSSARRRRAREGDSDDEDDEDDEDDKDEAKKGGPKQASNASSRSELRASARDAQRMQTDGFEYVHPSSLPESWGSLVSEAEAAVNAGLDRARLKDGLESINSQRLQLRFPRSDALPAPLRRVVDVLHERIVASCGRDLATYVLQDCYALLTPADEEGEVARAPQRWHLDAVKQFPVAALLLRGARATEFAAGAYSNLSAGVSERTLDCWCAPLRTLNTPTWEAESIEEWEHFGGHLHAMGLVTGVDVETGEPECDWDKLAIAPGPTDTAVPGSASIFWSNKVHRGPGTDLGEERLVLFCSWLPPSAAAASKRTGAKKESETDYSFYDVHLEPKLRLSKRAVRSQKRHRAS